MSSSNYRITLDMQSNQSQVSLPVRLKDTNRKLYIILTNGGTPYIIENGCRAVLFGYKADGNELINDCIIEDNSVIRYDFTPNTASAAGVVDCEIRLYDLSGELITSPRFILVVDSRVMYDDGVTSESERTAMDNILGSESARADAENERSANETARETAENARNVAETARANAETLRQEAELARANAELLREKAEIDREGFEFQRGENEFNRVSAELERQSAEVSRKSLTDTLMTMYNVIMGKNKTIELESAGELYQYLTNYGGSLVAGDVIILANEVFDFVYEGEPTEEEKAEAEADGRLYVQWDALMGNVTYEAGRRYIWGGASKEYKIYATSEKIDFPVGREEFDAHKREYEGRVDGIANSLGDIISDSATLRENSSNAIKGKATGEVVRVNDVSPIEHIVKCRVRSKNLYDNLNNYKNGTYTYSDGTLTVTDRYAHKFIKLEEDKTYTFSCKSTRTGVDGGGVHIRAYKEDQRTYVDIQGGSIINLLSPSFTLTMPKGYPYIRIALYGHATSDGTGSATYTELMLEESKVATGYVPYVDDVTTVAVTRSGKNLLDLSRATLTSATYNKDVNGITCKINNSYYSGVRVDYLNDFLLANKGKTLTFSIDSAIDDVLISLVIYGTRTSGKTNQEGSATGKREISFAISDEFTAITGLEVRVNRKTEAFTDTTTVVRNMQVEVGDTASDFEVYKETSTHTPSSDGTVLGIMSLAPTMTLLTDTANVVLEIGYNQDINVLNKKLVEALDAILKIQETLIGGTSQ